MDKKSKVLIVIFAMIVTASVVATFYRYILIKDIDFYTDDEAFKESLIEDGLLEEDSEEIVSEDDPQEISEVEEQEELELEE